MSTPIPTRVVQVAPQQVTTSNRGQIQENGDEVFQISDTGLQIISMWIWLVDVFELPEDADREQVVHHLVQGLQRAVGDHPEMTGTMHYDNEAKRVVIKRPEGGSLALHIKDATDHTEQIPSYAWFHEHDYPVHKLKVDQLIPPETATTGMQVAQDLSTPGPVVAAFQATFIRGGVIIGLAISHQVTDGLGCDAFMRTWAAYSKSSMTGAPSGLDPEIPPQTLFTAQSKPSPEEWEALRGKYPTMVYKTEPPAPPPADFVMPVVKTRVFHFRPEQIARLKAECAAGLPEGEFISSYDAVAALWWRAMLRAKRPLIGCADSDATHAIHAVNLRKRAGGDGPVSSRFIGSAVALPHSEYVTVGEALGPRGAALPLLARTVRGATRQVTPEYVRGQMAWAAGAPDLRYSQLDMPWVLGRDCMGFGWHDMDPYGKHDFGFGPPSGFRWPDICFESFFFMLPSRAGLKGSGPDEGVEVTFGIEESCFPRVRADEELLSFCEERGVGS